MLKKHKNILFSIIFIIIAFFGYWYFVLSKDSNAKSTSNTLTSKTASGSQQPAQKAYDKEFVANLQSIQYINLDTTVLTTNAYKALSFPETPFLVDYNIPVGRRNPFLPIDINSQESGTVNLQAQATTTATTPVATTTPRPTPTPR